MDLTLEKPVVSFAAEYVRRRTLRSVHHFLSEPDLPVYRDLKRLCERVSDNFRDRVVLERISRVLVLSASRPGQIPGLLAGREIFPARRLPSPPPPLFRRMLDASPV